MLKKNFTEYSEETFRTNGCWHTHVYLVVCKVKNEGSIKTNNNINFITSLCNPLYTILSAHARGDCRMVAKKSSLTLITKTGRVGGTAIDSI